MESRGCSQCLCFFYAKTVDKPSKFAYTVSIKHNKPMGLVGNADLQELSVYSRGI